jgi:signal transduction histidine kinase
MNAMRLADFIEANVEPILVAAEAFAATMLPAAGHLDSEALRDHMPMILDAIAKDLRSAQTAQEQLAKSLGQQPPIHGAPQTAAQTHALLRAKAGFDISQLVAEYRALRACVLRLWFERGSGDGVHLQDDLVRFNEAIDQAVAESVAFYTAEMDRWRHVFLGVLGHDLRGPLNAILLTAEVLSKMTTDAPLSRHTVRLIQSGHRMKTLLDDLLDFNRASLGLGIGLHRTDVELTQVCAEEIDLLRVALPKADITFSASGTVHGSFDASRVREVLGNLVTNAARYGTAGATIHVELTQESNHVTLSVANAGVAIPEQDIQALFEPLRRARPLDELPDRTSLGLGLFIVREIAKAHGGVIRVDSANGETVFTLVLPRGVYAAAGTAQG